jgi:hypothetical protein
LFIFAFRITLQPCCSEIDVSIVDRISFTEPTATLQKEHQICFRAHERCKNIDISSVNMRNICSDFILKAGAEGVELKIICIQYKFFYMFSAQITFEIKTICTVSRIFL